MVTGLVCNRCRVNEITGEGSEALKKTKRLPKKKTSKSCRDFPDFMGAEAFPSQTLQHNQVH